MRYKGWGGSARRHRQGGGWRCSARRHGLGREWSQWWKRREGRGRGQVGGRERLAMPPPRAAARQRLGQRCRQSCQSTCYVLCKTTHGAPCAVAAASRSRRARDATCRLNTLLIGFCGCKTRLFSSHEPSSPIHSQTFPKHSQNILHTQSATSRFACDGAGSLVSRTSENGGLSTVRDSGLFSRKRTSSGHVARSDSARFSAAFV